jgi:hypothetical protein
MFHFVYSPPIPSSLYRTAISVKSAAVIAGITVLFPLVCISLWRYKDGLTEHFIGHPQQEHDTRHGSMEHTTWFLEEEKEGIEVGGHKYGSGDSGAPMLCSLVCKSLGRHAHIAGCVAGENDQCAGGAEVQHVTSTRQMGRGVAKDWVTHNLYWKKSGQYFDSCFAFHDIHSPQVSRVQTSLLICYNTY